VNASAVQREMTESRPVNDVPNGNGAEPYKAKEPKKPEPLIITMDQIKAEKVDWLWKNRIPIGRLTMLDGDPGSGKSTLSLVIASAVSRGLPLPFGEKPKAAANVLFRVGASPPRC
jgi:predicted ATP-dependent serine protease